MLSVRSLVMLLLLLAYCQVAFAQKPASSQEQNRDFETPRVNATYDKFKDLTQVGFAPVFVVRPSTSPDHTGLAFGISAVYEGSTPKGPPSPSILSWVFVSTSFRRADKYSASHGVIVIADRERIRLGETNYDTAINSVQGTNVFIEQMVLLQVPLETTAKISNSKTVEIQIGETDFAPNETLMNAIREVVRRCQP
jgi:hypothetical protein